MFDSTTKFESYANRPSCFQQLQAVIYSVLYNKTTSTPIVKYLAKFLSTPNVKYEKIADSRTILNPKSPTLFFFPENSGTHKKLSYQIYQQQNTINNNSFKNNFIHTVYLTDHLSKFQAVNVTY